MTRSLSERSARGTAGRPGGARQHDTGLAAYKYGRDLARPDSIGACQRIRSGASALLFCLALTACAQARLQPLCPTLVPYGKSDQQALAAELRAHPDLVQTPRWLADYIGLRDQVRACRTGAEENKELHRP